MPDGTIYAGISPDTNQPMYATAEDVPDLLSYSQALAYARTLSQQTNKNFRLPTEIELAVIFKNHTAIGDFDTRQGAFPMAWYWSNRTSNFSLTSSAMNFSNGTHDYVNKVCRLSVRCVRS